MLRSLRCPRRAAVLVGLLTAVIGVPAASASARTLFVRSTSPAFGDGSLQHPFDTLSAVAQAAGPGDTITVLPAPAGAPPLEGGIALKPGQKLLGGGPPVAGISATSPASRIANSSSAQNSGDAVTLADGAEVANIAIVGAARGGIYGSDVRNVSVHDNDLTATNTSCTTGFVVQPFNLPTGLPGVGAPFNTGLPNGWAAIMVDAASVSTNVSLTDNFVHDAACADGIDVRASHTADIHAEVLRNTVTRIRQDPSKSSLLAIGLQTTDTSSLLAEVNNNTETYIGTAYVNDLGNADSEGLFSNSAGHSHLVERADHNTFAHGLGHLSANCIEAAASNGGPTHEVTITNSTCNYAVGDLIEAANLSTGATLTMNIDHVIAAHSTYPAATLQHPVLPGDDGDCLLEVASGSGSTTNVNIGNSQFTDCAADGIGVASNVVDGSSAPVKRMSFNIDNSRITGNQLSNLHILNATGVSELDGKVQNSDLSQSPGGTAVIAEQRYAAYTTSEHLDLGGGTLGSSGHNCIFGGALNDITTLNYDVIARHNWWGSPGGPAPGRTVAVGGTIADDPVLADAACGPTTTLDPVSPPRLASPSQASKHACSGKRVVRVTIKRRYRQHLLRASVLVSGRRVARLRQGHLGVRITLNGRTPRTIPVRILMRLRSGRFVVDARRYRVCS